ncbi:MAG TPA: universal stress protein [Candidatus Limnocylindrales bacterium]|nr:universal stress protein [Candidatus Limnocylindrales bacterium]
MYKSIYVPVDNSDHSNRAVACALTFGKAFSAKLVGCHVYAAKLHDYRFRQMEYTLPEEYIDEVELERQRKIHDSLITMGLKLISDSYLDGMARLCRESNLEFEPRMMDGKHHAEILKDLAGSQHDLVVIGAVGIGRARDSVIGSVCERVARQSDRDVWVVKHVPEPGEAERDTILVGVDGSPQSFGALMTAVELARTFDKKVEAIAVYDPYLHYSVFNGIVNVLTEQAAKVFRFEEQNQLHEEIIDTGLAQIYQSHLEVGERMGSEAGCAIKKTLLDGKPFQKILDHARKTSPWLIVLGRIGVHSPKDETALGSNVENILRGAPCDVLLSTRLEVPRLDVRAEETIRWTPEAEERMKHVPEQVKGIARTGVLRLALEKGHSVITSAVIDDAMDRFMPKSASAATRALAESVALERAKSGSVSMCRACGVTATQTDPVRCTVCGAADFEVISRETIERIAAVEGGLQEETTYDGRKLRWTEDARKGLWTMKNAYQRRRTKARVEKRARMKKLDAITLEFARQVIEEETGAPLQIQPRGFASPDPTPPPQRAGALGAPESSSLAGTPDGVKLIARDDRKNPLISTFDWTNDAAQRIFRVPAGFMRNKTQERIEELARERAAALAEGGVTIDLALVEEGIEFGKRMMAEMIATYPAQGTSPEGVTATRDSAGPSATATRSGYLNEANPPPSVTAERRASGEQRES